MRRFARTAPAVVAVCIGLILSGCGQSAPAATALGADVEAVSAVAPPSQLTAGLSGQTLTMRWKATGGAVTGYRVYVDQATPLDVPATTLSHQAPAGPPGTQHFLQVQAVAGDEVSAPVTAQVSVPYTSSGPAWEEVALGTAGTDSAGSGARSAPAPSSAGDTQPQQAPAQQAPAQQAPAQQPADAPAAAKPQQQPLAGVEITMDDYHSEIDTFPRNCATPRVWIDNQSSTAVRNVTITFHVLIFDGSHKPPRAKSGPNTSTGIRNVEVPPQTKYSRALKICIDPALLPPTPPGHAHPDAWVRGEAVISYAAYP